MNITFILSVSHKVKYRIKLNLAIKNIYLPLRKQKEIMKTITIADGINITANDETKKAYWHSIFDVREKMIARTKTDICVNILATITRDIMQLVEFEVNEETSEIVGRLSIELSDEQYLKHIRKDLKF